MKTKYITIILALFIVSATGYSQLKVDQYGRIGMGTNWPNPGYKCHIKGNLLLTTYPASPFIEFQFKVGNGWPGAEFGTNIDQVAVWSPWVNYNKLYAEQYYRLSDASFKLNITIIQSPLEKILELKPHRYDMIDRYISETGDSLERTIPQYGFISQEVEKDLPEIKITDDGKYGKLMDYDQVIPLLVAGMQERQKQINLLESSLAKVLASKSTTPINDDQIQGNGSKDNNIDKCRLYNGSPNPFNNSINIPFYLSDNTTSAKIKVWDMQGVQKKEFILTPQQGNGNVTISSSDLSIGGSYICALFANSQIIEANTIIYNN